MSIDSNLANIPRLLVHVQFCQNVWEILCSRMNEEGSANGSISTTSASSDTATASVDAIRDEL